MMNRTERRLYQRSIKGNNAVSKCPCCGYDSLFTTCPKLKPYEGEKTQFVAEDFDIVVKCDICDSVVLESEALTRLIRPGVHLPLPLDIFTMALHYEEENETEDEEI